MRCICRCRIILPYRWRYRRGHAAVYSNNLISPTVVRDLGCVDYLTTWEAMRRFTAERSPATPDEFWTVEHPPVYTLGVAGRREHLLQTGDIPVIQTDRGGQVTYHGPGQVIVYPLVDLRRCQIKVREWVSLIEDAVIETLATWAVMGQRRPGAPGVYVAVGDDLQKISALGLKIRNGCSYHGVSLNVSMDLAPFSQIDPCGYPGLRVTDLSSLGPVVPLDIVAHRLVELIRFRIEALAPGTVDIAVQEVSNNSPL